eukprot:gene6631-4751_t
MAHEMTENKSLLFALCLAAAQSCGLTDLAQFDGRGENPIYISVKGIVYDCSTGEDFYGEGKAYAVFAGKEVSRCLAKMIIGDEEANAGWNNLTEEHIDCLNSWIAKYKEKYPVVGTFMPDPGFMDLLATEGPSGLPTHLSVKNGHTHSTHVESKLILQLMCLPYHSTQFIFYTSDNPVQYYIRLSTNIFYSPDTSKGPEVARATVHTKPKTPASDSMTSLTITMPPGWLYRPQLFGMGTSMNLTLPPSLLFCLSPPRRISVATAGRVPTLHLPGDGGSDREISYPARPGRTSTRNWREGYDDLQQDLREELWATKAELDPISDEAYMAARNTVFPKAAGGGRRHQFTNRAGYKLLESMEAVDVWERLAPPSHASSTRATKRARKDKVKRDFVDLCGGPGSFSQALFFEGARRGIAFYGYGLTLCGVNGLDWYEELRSSSEFTVTYGPFGTGDIFERGTVDGLVSITGASAIPLVVADGGFHVTQDKSNFQETISGRITYAQWYANLRVQSTGGTFVLKLFDTFSPLTRALLYLSAFVYDEVWIVKPQHSRCVNSERYLVCVGFQGLPEAWLAYLDRCFTRGFLSEQLCVPTVIPDEWARGDKTFIEDLQAMNEAIARTQICALQRVLEAVRMTATEAPESRAGPGVGGSSFSKRTSLVVLRKKKKEKERKTSGSLCKSQSLNSARTNSFLSLPLLISLLIYSLIVAG